MMFERFFRKRPKSPEAVTSGLRRQAFEVTAADLRLEPTPALPHVFGAIMETGYDLGVATLVVLAEGSVSLYFSGGGGVIGAGRHQAVTKAADALLEAAEAVRSQLQPAQGTPPPAAGRIRFYLRTFEGTLTAETEERSLAEGHHSLSSLFHAAHEVIGRIRESTPDASTTAR
jgi:hypothetical protein